MTQFVNLSSVTLFKTISFNIIDSTLFQSETARDAFFDAIPVDDKIFIDECTDLYNGVELKLPYNYLDLKRFNIMKLHYLDDLGHESIEYCNVDNYLYLSQETCVPLYRVDYMLTYGHLLYGMKIDLITDRRTVWDRNITKYMKADEMTVPKINYLPLFVGTQKKHNYIVFLNKVPTGVTGAKKGIKVEMSIPIGLDASSRMVTKTIESYTTGCYVLICNDTHFSSIIDNIPQEYIEKIVESEINPNDYIDSIDIETYNTNGYVYLTNDVLGNPGLYVEIDDIHDTKKILQSLPYNGYVVNGYEYSPKDFDINDIPLDDNVVTYKIKPSLYVFTAFDQTFVFPIAYRGVSVNYDYMQTWQSARSFNYISNYMNSLAYKELVEKNNQAVEYANKSAGIASYYANQLNQNANKQLDASKLANNLSYQSQINSLNNQIASIDIEQEALNPSGGGFIGDLYNGLASFIKGARSAFVGKNFYVEKAQIMGNNNLNKSLYNAQITNLMNQNTTANYAIDLQKQANNINARYQADTSAIARDNAIANVAISNKYNNAQPNAYMANDYTKYNTYIYKIGIDNRNGKDYTQYENLVNYYNINGVRVGYLESWDTTQPEGNYFFYIKGSVIDNKGALSDIIPLDILVNLLYRIEQGVRLWHNLEWFGDVTTDNTYEDLPLPPFNTFSLSRKRELEKYVMNLVWENDRSTVTSIINGSINYTELERDYMNWYNISLYWGVQDIDIVRQDYLIKLMVRLQSIYSNAEIKNQLRSDDNLTIYEVQYVQNLID